MLFIALISSILFGYLIGSISNGVIIGKLFFGVDIRTKGSNNSGGTNAGRILGKKIGLLTIVLDGLKTTFVIVILNMIFTLSGLNTYFNLPSSIFSYLGGISACLGHIFPLYFNFKGGKVVSCFAGICVATNWIICLVGLSLYIIILYLCKYVSLTSIITSIIVFILTLFGFIKYGMWLYAEYDIYYQLMYFVVMILIIVRHHQNIKRLINGQENKIKWMSKKSV